MDAFLLPRVVAYCFGRTREDTHGKHCKNCRLGSGEEFVPRVLCGLGGESFAVEEAATQPGSAVLRGAGSTVHGGDGDVHGGELVVSPAAGSRVRRAADPGGLREAVREEPEERRAGRGGDLRGGAASQHEVRAGEERGGVDRAGRASHAPPPDEAAHDEHQPRPVGVRRVRRGRGAEVGGLRTADRPSA